MTLPSILFGILISTAFGTGFHMIRGGGFGSILADIVFSWIGFWIGHYGAERLEWYFWSIGPLHVGMATFGSLGLMILGSWITTNKK